MPSSAWRLLFLPFVLLAFLLVGAPDFPAFQRAIQKAFATEPTTAAPAPAPRSKEPLAPLGPTRSARSPEPEGQTRGVLVPLYASFALLQALDAHSTLRAVDGGAAEANPIMGAIAHEPVALLAVKAGLTASTIYLVEKVRVRSRGAAIALMAVLNSAYVTIVAHNYRVPR